MGSGKHGAMPHAKFVLCPWHMAHHKNIRRAKLYPFLLFNLANGLEKLFFVPIHERKHSALDKRTPAEVFMKVAINF